MGNSAKIKQHRERAIIGLFGQKRVISALGARDLWCFYMTTRAMNVIRFLLGDLCQLNIPDRNGIGCVAVVNIEPTAVNGIRKRCGLTPAQLRDHLRN